MGEEFWPLFFAFSWVWIPIIAILVGGITEWLKFREKHRKLGASTEEMEQEIAALKETVERQQQMLVRRLENLEAIVTSQSWDLLHDEVLPEHEKRQHLADARLELDGRNEELPDERKAALLARRMKT